MISIQELGLSILSDHPSSLYILGGDEYGIKDKYIDKLTEFYKGSKYEYPSVNDVISTMSVKHIIPLKPSLYVVRYDEAFVSAINETYAVKIKSTKIVGTLVCIYSDSKQVAKIDKFLPEYTSEIYAVNSNLIAKYLKQDFPNLDARCISLAASCGQTYGHARTICKSLSHLDKDVIAATSDKRLQNLFGCSDAAIESDIRIGVASRNFRFLSVTLDRYEGDRSSLYYTILQTMIDMEKLLTSKYLDIDIKEYKSRWRLQDVYNMFMNTYIELSNSRSSLTSSSIESSLIYLFALLSFREIPSPEALNDF